jgi:hypothetical protein
MTTLAHQQQALLDALLATPSSNAAKNIATYIDAASERGLKTYQANGHALAERALQAAYPVVADMLGVESFASLARALWHAHPAQCGDIAQWGEALSEFVRQSPQLQDEPYVADVAKLEWALHCAAYAADAQVDASSLALLASEDPAVLHLRLAAGWAVVASVWPIVHIWTAHRQGSPSLAQVGADIRSGLAQDAVVWRQGLRPKVRLAHTDELPFLQVLAAGGTLQNALDAAPALDIGAWLTGAVQTGWLVGVTR